MMEGDILYILAAAVVGLVIGVYFTRWVFGIDKMLAYQEDMAKSLRELRKLVPESATAQQKKSEIQAKLSEMKTQYGTDKEGYSKAVDSYLRSIVD